MWFYGLTTTVEANFSVKIYFFEIQKKMERKEELLFKRDFLV
jgi:hypothetical protein